MANLSAGAICLLSAVVFRNYKNAANLIAGYNTLSEKEKAKHDAKELCRFISKLTLGWAVLMIVAGIFIILNIAAWVMLISSWCIFAITLVLSIIHRSRSARFRA
jgi:hypothetical protein